jgi:hypothetical protein
MRYPVWKSLRTTVTSVTAVTPLILLTLSAAADAESLTFRPSSLKMSRTFCCSSFRMRHPVLSSNLSFSTVISENAFIYEHKLAKRILQAILKTPFSMSTQGVLTNVSGRRGGSS